MVGGSGVVHCTHIKVYSISGRFHVTQQRFRLEKYIRSIQHNVNILIFYLFVSVRLSVGLVYVLSVKNANGWQWWHNVSHWNEQTSPNRTIFILYSRWAMDARLLRRHRHHRWFRLPISCTRIWNCRFSHSQHLHKIYKNIHTQPTQPSLVLHFFQSNREMCSRLCVCMVCASEWIQDVVVSTIINIASKFSTSLSSARGCSLPCFHAQHLCTTNFSFSEFNILLSYASHSLFRSLLCAHLCLTLKDFVASSVCSHKHEPFLLLRNIIGLTQWQCVYALTSVWTVQNVFFPFLTPFFFLLLLVFFSMRDSLHHCDMKNHCLQLTHTRLTLTDVWRVESSMD